MSVIRSLCHGGGVLTWRGKAPPDFEASLKNVIGSFRNEVLSLAEKAQIKMDSLTIFKANDMVVVVDIYACHIVLAGSGGNDCIHYVESNASLDAQKLWENVELKVGTPVFALKIPKYQMVTCFEPYIKNDARRYIAELSGNIRHENLLQPNTKMPTAPDPVELSAGLKRFRDDHPPPQKTAFIVMSFQTTHAHDMIVETIKKSLAKHGIQALRADDKEYHEDLFPNVRIYMHGCTFGVAVFERIMQDDINPNVSLEVGYLLSQDKNVLLLKDQTHKNLQSDLVGKLYKNFDPQKIADTLPAQIDKWLKDKGHI